MYAVFITKITTKHHPNADRLKLGMCRGYQVIVGLDTQDGDLGLFFPTDGQLSEEFAKANDLIRRKDAYGNNAGGMFDVNRRVRAQVFRGERSDGFWIPVSSLTYIPVDFVDGMELPRDANDVTVLKGHPIAQKYQTPATRAASNVELARRGTEMFRKLVETFRKHVETEQLRDYTDKIPVGARLVFSEKQHGTSHRLGLVIDPVRKQGRVRTVVNCILKRLLGLEPPLHWEYLSGTRNVILNTAGAKTYYAGDAFRNTAIAPLIGNLYKGEIVYGEIVGYTETGALIMASSSTKDLSDKSIRKTYGDQMVFDYGLKPPQCKLYVYRITMTNEQGICIDYSWEATKRRCQELSVDYVPEIAPPKLYDGDGPALIAYCESLVEGCSCLDTGHICEGVVVRVDSAPTYTAYKFKSHLFGVLEGYVKDTGAVDMEEAA